MSRKAHTVALGLTIAVTHLAAQPPEKLLLTRTLNDLSAELPSQELEWFKTAAAKWEPQRDDEGQDFRYSLQLMLREIRRARKQNKLTNDLIATITDDLRIKREHCKAMGLAVPEQVEVKTKRQGLDEVKGLEVWYLEKFLALDPAPNPHRFRGFSSPVNDTIVPGRYLFWAKDPVSGKSGEKVEQRVGRSAPNPVASKTAIELLAP